MSTGGRGLSFFGLVFALLVGAAYVLLSLPTRATSLAERWQWMQRPARWSVDLDATLPDISDLTRYIGYALLAYLCALALLALRHGRLGYFGRGVALLVASTVVLHALAWIGWITFYVGRFIFRVLSAVGNYVSSLFEPVSRGGQRFRERVFGQIRELFAPLFGDKWWIGALLAVVAIVLVLAWLSSRGPGALKVVAKGILYVSVGLAVLYAVIRLTAFVWEKAGATILKILLYVIAGFLIWLALTTVGQLFLDQIKSAMLAGNGRLGVVMGAIAIGSALAILLLVGNIYTAYDWYPGPVERFADGHLHQDTPSFDALVALCIVALSVVGILRNIPRLRPEPTAEEFGKSMIYTILGVMVGGTLGAAGADD